MQVFMKPLIPTLLWCDMSVRVKHVQDCRVFQQQRKGRSRRGNARRVKQKLIGNLPGVKGLIQVFQQIYYIFYKFPS